MKEDIVQLMFNSNWFS